MEATITAYIGFRVLVSEFRIQGPQLAISDKETY